MIRICVGPEDYTDYGSKSCIASGRKALWSGIVWAGKIIIANAIKSLPSFLTVNHTDSDIGHLKHCVQIFQSASYITVHLAFLQLEEFPMPLIQLNY